MNARELLERISHASSAEEINDVSNEFLAAARHHPELLHELGGIHSDVLAAYEDAKIRRAATVAVWAAHVLAIAHPVNLLADWQTAAAAGPSSERLMAGLLLMQEAHQLVPFDETSVMGATDPLHAPDFSDYQDVYARSVDLLRTAGYFVLDAREAHAAILSEPPMQETFPPLPFPRVWIEMRAPGIDRPFPYMRFGYDDNRSMDVLGIGVAEVDPGRLWDIYIACESDRETEKFFLAERISPCSVVASDPAFGQATEMSFAAIRRLVVAGVHLISARNVPHDPVELPRHQRKRLPTLIGPFSPRIYFVNLGAAGEHAHRTDSGRKYSVRWLVRGHWRHIDAATQTCTCCTPPAAAKWIHPYIKGPVGAPWKGRAIHVHRSPPNPDHQENDA